MIGVNISTFIEHAPIAIINVVLVVKSRDSISLKTLEHKKRIFKSLPRKLS